MPFTDRRDAGRRLVARLGPWRGADVVVLGLPRGGVAVAAEVARALGAPLDVVLVRKVGLPYQPELALGALGEGGVRLVDPGLVRRYGITPAELAAVETAEGAELDRRAARFAGGRARPALAGRTAIVVDDGMATGASARAAVAVARAAGAVRVVVAVPVAARGALRALAADADDVVCLECPSAFSAVGQWYADFPQTTDEEVTRLLGGQAADGDATAGGEIDGVEGGVEGEVTAYAGAVPLAGRLTVPEGAGGCVVFAHGSGSGRHSPRARSAADVLHRAGVATLLVDLLTPSEQDDRVRVFAVELLAVRLVEATRWVRRRTGLPVGYLGTGTGAAAALLASTDYRVRIAAVVALGGRPDLAAKRLGWVRVPTMLIAAASDHAALEANRVAQDLVSGPTRLAVVPGATPLFEEPGALGAAAELARDWFRRHLVPVPAAGSGHPARP